MFSHRSFILQLVARGRITPDEADHLLADWNDSWQFVWIVAACFAAASLNQPHLHAALPVLMHHLNALLPGGITSLHHAAMHQIHLPGGTI
jgi:hypothetical protein